MPERVFLFFNRTKYFFLLAIAFGCVDPYAPPLVKSTSNILVVDGFLSSSSNSAIVKLSRAISLSDDVSFPKEGNALVSIESMSGATFNLNETSHGTYEISGINASTEEKYQLHIQTTDGKDYRSDYIQLKQAPPIDSITWEPDAEGITLFVSSHDPSAKTHYYQWVYKETWEYRSAYGSNYYLIDGAAVPRPESEGINICWNSELSPKILINSTLKLSEDRVNKFPLTFIPRAPAEQPSSPENTASLLSKEPSPRKLLISGHNCRSLLKTSVDYLTRFRLR